MKILDTVADVTRFIPALKSRGIECVFRYITPNMAGQKCVKPAEARALATSGMKLGLVFEIWGGSGNFSHHDINASTGIAHAQFALGYAPQVGAPPETIIYFAVDNDVLPGWYTAYVKPYFGSVHHILGTHFRTGVYGCGYICERLVADGICDATWLSQSMRWNGSRAYRASGKWRLLQGPQQHLAGLGIDSDFPGSIQGHEVSSTDYGGFVPFAGVKP